LFSHRTDAGGSPSPRSSSAWSRSSSAWPRSSSAWSRSRPAEARAGTTEARAGASDRRTRSTCRCAAMRRCAFAATGYRATDQRAKAVDDLSSRRQHVRTRPRSVLASHGSAPSRVLAACLADVAIYQSSRTPGFLRAMPPRVPETTRQAAHAASRRGALPRGPLASDVSY
jgi:hypothetical protein